MNYNEIEGNIKKEYYNYNTKVKQYAPGHVFDENKSVKWNKEEVARVNQENKKEANKRMNGLTQFKSDVIDYMITQGLNKKQSEKIMDYAWEEGHSYGYYEVLMIADELLDLVNDVIKLS